MYFELVLSHIICQVLTYLKSHSKFHRDIHITLSEEMLNFFDIVGVQGETESVLEKNISDEKEMRKNINGTKSETEFASVEVPLNMHRSVSNETTLVSEIANTINKRNVLIATRQGKTPVSVLSDEFCEEQAFPYLLPKVNFCYNTP